MSQNVMTPLLVDSRLTLPAVQSSKIAANVAPAIQRLSTDRAGLAQPVAAAARPAAPPVRQTLAPPVRPATPAAPETPKSSPTDLSHLRMQPLNTSVRDSAPLPMPKSGIPGTSSATPGGKEAPAAAPAQPAAAPAGPAPATGASMKADFAHLANHADPNIRGMYQHMQQVPDSANPAQIHAHMNQNPTYLKSTNPTAAGAANLGWTKAIGGGAALGGLKGLVDPGTSTDDNGNQVQNNRFGAMLGGAATGAAVGGLGKKFINAGGNMALDRAATTPLPLAKAAFVTLGLPTLPFSKRADRIIKHPGSPGPRGGSTDACLNRASEGPACTNTDAVTSTSKLASADSPETGATYNKAQAAPGTAPLSGPATMDKGPDGAKAETTDHAKRVALAKQETDGSTSLHTAPTKTPAVTAVDREKAVQQFPVLSLRK